MPFTVREAARRLDVSEREIRRLISAGVLQAERFANAWMVDVDTVHQRSTHRPGRGRPWAPHVAWAALWHLSGLEVTWLHPNDMSRLRRRIREADPESLARSTRSRGRIERCRVMPIYLDRLAATDGLVRTGVSAVDDAGADLISTDAAEFYCPPELWTHLFNYYGVERAGADANLIVHLPTAEPDLPIVAHRDVMPAAVGAVDLLESTNTRTLRAGRDLIRQLQAGVHP